MRLSSAAASPAEQVSIELSLSWPSGRERPSALQWETTIPVAQLAEENLLAGPSAQVAGKSVSCRVKAATDTTQTSICILYGGREPIPDGVVAVLSLKIAPDAQPGPVRIRIDPAMAVLKDLEKVPMKPAEAVVTIRRK